MTIFEKIKTFYLYILVVFAAFSLMVFASYAYVSEIVRAQMLRYGEETMNSAEANVRMTLMEAEILLNNVTFTVENMINEGATQEEILSYLIRWSARMGIYDQNLLSVYGYVRGDVLDGQVGRELPPDFDAKTRPWYLGALSRNGKTSYSEPYLDIEKKQAVISVSRKIYNNNNESQGVVAVDVDITNIAHFVQNLRLMNSGYGVMLNEEFRFVVHPNPLYVGADMVDVAEDENAVPSTYASLGKQLQNGKTVFAERFSDYDGVDSLVFFKQLFNKWYVGIVTPVHSFYGRVFDMAVVLSVLGFCLMSFLSYFLILLSLGKLRSDAANKMKTSFIANMSHEIRTPMNAIMGMSEMILREMPKDTSIAEYAWEIKRASANLLDIVNDILDISKIEAGRLELVPVEYEFSSVINDVVSIVRMRIGHKPIDFIVDIDSRLPFKLIGDELRLKQMLLNILGNAVKFTEKGYVRLVVRGKCLDKKLQLEFEIADSGFGIKKDDMETLFKEFTRVDTKKNRSVEGTGLGLSITRKLCEMMDGTIKVSSRYGLGSTFTLCVTQKIVDSTPLAAVAKAKDMRVVIFEKSPLLQSSLASTATNLGVICDVCASRDGFYRLLQEYRYDYAFISASDYQDLEGETLPEGMSAVLVADYDQVFREGNMLVLRKPVTCIQIANLLNDVLKDTQMDGTSSSEKFFAPEARILIVDDNITNLKVASGLMGVYEMKIDTALSGAEALNKLKRFSYDLIFMDHMMPEMDGVETTIEIRRLEGEYYKNLPIVALTANAVSGAKELFLQKGMNDFLSKPINSKKLKAILKKYLPAEKCLTVSHVPTTEKKTEELVIAGINVRKGMINCGNTEANYRSVLSIFHADGKSKTTLLKEMVDAGDISDFTILIHALKSACAQIGAETASELAAKLESAGRSGDVDFIQNNLSLFMKNFELVLENISPHMAVTEKDERAGPEGDEALLDDRLRALAELLPFSDTAAIDTVLEELLKYSWSEAINIRLKMIKDLVDVFDFDEALKIVQGQENK